MERYVKCWHCNHFIWFSLDDENKYARCDIKQACVLANDTVCKDFVLSAGIHTTRKIPACCENYNKKGN